MDIDWLIAEDFESQWETCQRYQLSTYTFNSNEIFQWNSSIVRYVVEDVLNKTLLFGGVGGCCESGVWCDSTSCFTQNYGRSFSNYGWIKGDNSNFAPVYTCIPTVVDEDDNINNTISIENVYYGTANTNTNNNILLSINTSITDISSLNINLGNSRCLNAESCLYYNCTEDIDCPIGMGCYSSSIYQNNIGKQCYQYCSGNFDFSCSCNQTCTEYQNNYICTSSSSTLFNSSITSTSTTLSCNSMGGIYQIPSPQRNLSVEINTIGTSKRVTNQVYCSDDTDCNDGNVCTYDYCTTNHTCESVNLSNCSTIPYDIIQQSTSYTYLQSTTTTTTNNNNDFQTMVDLLFQSNTAEIVSSSGVTIPLPFTFVYFGTRISEVMISQLGFIYLPPLPDICTNALVK
jgi:hypothetical protein